MKIVVQKFGGTSVSTDESRKQVIEKVKNAIKEGYSPILVVSAMGRKGEPYATDTLLSLIAFLTFSMTFFLLSSVDTEVPPNFCTTIFIAFPPITVLPF